MFARHHCWLLAAAVVATGGCLDAEGQTPERAAAAEKPPAESKAEKVVRSEKEWRVILSPEEFHVLRQKGTEAPFKNKYDEHFEPGAYACRACGQVLFESDTKFNSGCGWPAFYAAKAGDRVELHRDLTHGMVRTEVTCARCDSHLGHVFDDAPQTPTGTRYCINSVSLKFIPAKTQGVQADPTAAPPVEDAAEPTSDAAEG